MCDTLGRSENANLKIAALESGTVVITSDSWQTTRLAGEARTLATAASRPPQLTVIVPVFNERSTIEEIVCRVQSVAIEKEILVVDDCSSDGGQEILAQISQQVRNGHSSLARDDGRGLLRIDNVRVLFQPKNCGKGAAVRRAIGEAKGEFIVVQDADLELDPQDYLSLIAPLMEGKADLVNGSRFLYQVKQQGDATWRSLGNKIFTAVSNLTTGLRLTDTCCCYKMATREVFRNIDLTEDGFSHEIEIITKAARAGYRVAEVPVSYSPRARSDGKKINWGDCMHAFWCIFRYRLFR